MSKNLIHINGYEYSIVNNTKYDSPDSLIAAYCVKNKTSSFDEVNKEMASQSISLKEANQNLFDRSVSFHESELIKTTRYQERQSYKNKVIAVYALYVFFKFIQ